MRWFLTYSFGRLGAFGIWSFRTSVLGDGATKSESNVSAVEQTGQRAEALLVSGRAAEVLFRNHPNQLR